MAARPRGAACSPRRAARKRNGGGAKPRDGARKRVRFTAEEEAFLRDTVPKLLHSSSVWSDILIQGRGVFHPDRTNVDLKDKWRNMNKARAQVSARAHRHVLGGGRACEGGERAGGRRRLGVHVQVVERALPAVGAEDTRCE